MDALLERLAVTGASLPDSDAVLTEDALAFLARLHDEFEPRRRELLQKRVARQAELDAGAALDFLPETAAVRQEHWRVASAPRDLQDRRVEITGPVDRKMMINALNSGANVFMADFEDATSPTWRNLIEGQKNLQDAVRGTLSLEAGGKQYRLNQHTATLVVRPRGWHLTEQHVCIDGDRISGSLFDFGLHFFHNARALLERGSGPYFYLPKLESHLEARLWNDVFGYAQEALDIPQGSIRATVLIETIPAAFEMDEILYELRDHAAGLNAGRWDYIFSFIKRHRHQASMVLPDRGQVTMAVPFMSAYTDLLVRTCHRRGAHAMGGMAAFIPSRRDADVNERALAKVREDKERESGKGFDGTWVAHPDLVPVARAVFDRVLGDRPHQKEVTRDEVRPDAAALLDAHIEGGQVTTAGVRQNIDVAIRYLAAWLASQGAVAIHNLMEDAATAEISRAQLWQWLQHGVRLEDGTAFDREYYLEQRQQAQAEVAAEGAWGDRVDAAAALLDELVLADEFTEFLTLPGYELLDTEAES